jgi:hypothetical protein
MRTARQISALAKASRKSTPIPQKPVVSQDDDDVDDDGCDLAYMRDRILHQFFIDRNGAIHRFLGSLKDPDVISLHYRIAADLFPDIQYPDSPDDHVVKKLGWILCGSTVYHSPITYKKPSAAQIKTLQTLGSWYYTTLCFPYKGNMVKYDKYGILCDDL